MSARVYLDWNATAPIRAEARAAAIAAMEVIGNPSSVHAEGRAARALIERARAQVAAATGCQLGEVIFTSGATEAAAMALSGRSCVGSALEHPCVAGWIEPSLPVDRRGHVAVAEPGRSVLQAANSETGIVQELPQGLACVDAVPAIGRIAFAFDRSGARRALVAAHKLGAPKGVGALLVAPGVEVTPVLRGGGQEMRRRPGTENLVGIAAFGAAIEAAAADLARGIWDEVAEVRNNLEEALASASDATIFVGKAERRLPNTSFIATPGWAGETQVMQMDLAGFAVSAGSACSSGKVQASGVLTAMGFGPEVATSVIRVSIGPSTTREEVLRFADAWGRHYRRFRAKAA